MKMEDDEIIKEVRKTRDAHAVKFNFDLHKICDDFKRIQKECGHEVVSLPPKRLVTTKKSPANIS